MSDTPEAPPEKPVRATGSGAFQPGYDPRRNGPHTSRKSVQGKQIAIAAREKSWRALEVLEEAMNDTKAKWADRITAATHIIARGHGSISQMVHLTGNIGNELTPTVDLTKIPADLRRMLLESKYDADEVIEVDAVVVKNDDE